MAKPFRPAWQRYRRVVAATLDIPVSLVYILTIGYVDLRWADRYRHNTLRVVAMKRRREGVNG